MKSITLLSELRLFWNDLLSKEMEIELVRGLVNQCTEKSLSIIKHNYVKNLDGKTRSLKNSKI